MLKGYNLEMCQRVHPRIALRRDVLLSNFLLKINRLAVGKAVSGRQGGAGLTKQMQILFFFQRGGQKGSLHGALVSKQSGIGSYRLSHVVYEFNVSLGA